MSDNMHNPLEAVPRIQDLYTDPSDPALLDRLIAETDDNRHIDLNNMGLRNPERASLRFIVCTQVEGYDAAVSKLVEDVDYLLIDSSYTGNGAGRRVHDVALMAGFCSTRLYAEPPVGDGPTWIGFHEVMPSPGPRDPVVRRFVDSPRYKEREEKPIIRTIGLGMEDRLPSRITVGESREFAGKIINDFFDAKLFTSLNGQLLERLKGIMAHSVPELKAVDKQLRTDISTMVGNAIVRSGWHKHPKFGVVLDARHEDVALELAGLELFHDTSVKYEPFFTVDSATFLPSAFDRAEREMANDPNNRVKPATLERVLLGRYLEKTFLERLDNSDRETEWAVRSLDFELSDEEVSAFLHEIESAKKARISSVDLRRRPVAERRRDKVKKLIWNHPYVVRLRRTKL